MSAPLRGSGRPRRGRGGVSAVVPAPSARDQDHEETEEVRGLRAKFGPKLATAKELFPDWTDEDVLYALQEANGDLEVTIVRMSEGLAQQWGAVKTKKEKKVEKAVAAAPPAPAVAPAAQRGGFAGASRGGRGGFEGARGGRGGARGGRGGRGGAVGVNGAVRSSATATQTNGASADVNSVTPASFVPAPTPTGVWGKPVADATSSDPTASSTPASWADETATAAESAEAPSSAASKEALDASEKAAAAPAQVEAPKAAPRTIAPGSTRSWASIARPVSPPKPIPAPAPAPAPSAPASVPSAAASTTVPAVAENAPEPVTAPEAPAPTVADAAAPTISLPSVAPAESAAPAQPAYDPWGSTPAAAPSPAPLAVGEGWADSIVAAKASTEHDAAFKREIDAHLPPNDIDTAGPIDVNASAVPAAPAHTQSADSTQQQPSQDKFLGTGPPGLPPKRLQQEAVVLPGQGATNAVDRVGLQFGSLDLLDGAKQDAQPEQSAPPAADAPAAYQQQQAPQQPQPQQQTQAHSQPPQSQPQQAHTVAPAQIQAPQYQHAYGQPFQPEQSVQTAFSQAPAAQSNLFPGQTSSAFSQRYPTMPSPYQQFQQQQPAASLTDDQSAYGAFKATEAATPAQQAVSSPYFQQPASHSPAPAAAQQIQSPYAAFNSIPQQQQAPGQPFGSQQTDYSSLYGQQDSMRSMQGFYDAYGQFANQAPSPVPTRPEDSTPSTQASQPSATPGNAQGQQQQQLPAQHSFYGGMPYYNPYQAYGGYGYQVPPNYAALQSQFYGNYQPQQQQPQQQQQQRYAGAPQQQPTGPQPGQPGAAGSPAVQAQQQPGAQQGQAQGQQAFGGAARYGAQAYGAPGAGVAQPQQLYGSYGKDVTQDSSRFFGGH